MKKLILSASIIFCICFLQAKNTISLNMGTAIPINWNYGNAVYAGFSQGYSINPVFNVGLDISYNFNHRKFINNLKQEVKTLNLIPYLEYNLSLKKSVIYSYFGIGISFVNMDDDTTVPDMDDMTKRYFTAILGCGYMCKFFKNTYIGFDVRYQHIFRSGGIINNVIPTTKISYIF